MLFFTDHRNITVARRKLDPLGVIRDPDHEMIDTNVDHEAIRPERRTQALV